MTAPMVAVGRGAGVLGRGTRGMAETRAQGCWCHKLGIAKDVRVRRTDAT